MTTIDINACCLKLYFSVLDEPSSYQRFYIYHIDTPVRNVFDVLKCFNRTVYVIRYYPCLNCLYLKNVFTLNLHKKRAGILLVDQPSF